MAKELVILCDGTGNSPEANIGCGTNVQVLKDVLANGNPTKSRVQANTQEGWEIDQFNVQDKTRFVYYDRGLGAPSLNLDGSVLAWSWKPSSFFNDAKMVYKKFQGIDEEVAASGIIDNVAQAYRFLVQHYETGDQIYLFGFSRGAYTLRLLVTVLRYIGLLDRSRFPDGTSINQAIEKGFKLYNIDLHPDVDSNEAKAFRAQYCYSEHKLIHFLGLWDTVRGLVKEKVYEDAKLSSMVNIARHAVSIDERRSIFKPELWVARKETDSLQMWFSGAHCDIGGGYTERGLANISLHWMIAEAIKCGLMINLDILDAPEFHPDPLAMQHDSYNAKVQDNMLTTWSEICDAYRRPIVQMTMTEALHDSVYTRYGQTVNRNEDATYKYYPANLSHILVALENFSKAFGFPTLANIANLMPDPDELSDVGDDTSLIGQNNRMRILKL
jgi:hypothetical protein